MKTSVLVSLLRVVGVSFIILNLILLMTPTTVLPEFLVGSPPVDIIRERSGLYYTDESGYYHMISIRNRSDKNQTVVVVLKTDLDYEPRRSDPVSLSPYGEKDVVIVPKQPTSATNLEKYIDFLTKPSVLKVENAETPLPSGSFVTLIVHMILQVGFFVLGGVCLGVAQYISREKRGRYFQQSFGKNPFLCPCVQDCPTTLRRPASLS